MGAQPACTRAAQGRARERRGHSYPATTPVACPAPAHQHLDHASAAVRLVGSVEYIDGTWAGQLLFCFQWRCLSAARPHAELSRAHFATDSSSCTCASGRAAACSKASRPPLRSRRHSLRRLRQSHCSCKRPARARGGWALCSRCSRWASRTRLASRWRRSPHARAPSSERPRPRWAPGANSSPLPDRQLPDRRDATAAPVSETPCHERSCHSATQPLGHSVTPASSC